MASLSFNKPTLATPNHVINHHHPILPCYFSASPRHPIFTFNAKVCIPKREEPHPKWTVIPNTFSLVQFCLIEKCSFKISFLEPGSKQGSHWIWLMSLNFKQLFSPPCHCLKNNLFHSSWFLPIFHQYGNIIKGHPSYELYRELVYSASFSIKC